MNKDQIVEKLKAGIAEIVFTKKDGSERIMVGTLMPIHVRGKILGSGRTVPDHLIPLIDLEKNQWRSFDIDSLKSFKVLG